MDTQIITNPSDQELDMLARALRNGEIVSIPTETVYGDVYKRQVSGFLCNTIFLIKLLFNILMIN